MNSAESSSSQRLVPAFCHSRGVLAVVVLAQAVAIVLAFAPDTRGDPWLRLGVISLFVQWTSLLSLAVLCRLGSCLSRFSALLQGGAVLLVLLSLTALVSLLALHFLTGFGWMPVGGAGYFIAANLMIALLVGLLAVQFSLMHIERSVRLAAQSQAELEALHARIRPHFLFNSLNTTAELIHQNPVAAEQTLLDLAALFRAAIQSGNQASMADELALGRQYLSLEQWRLGQRLKVTWQLCDPIPNATLPVLTIQPLLENAIYHGIEPDPAGGDLCIELTQSSHSLVLCISNSVPAESTISRGNGMALSNIEQRLAMLYHDKAQFTVRRKQQRFMVQLILPLEPSKQAL